MIDTINISVIVVSYNTADLLTLCVDSVLKQRAVSSELIVVDNHSQDHSLAVLQAFGSQVTVIANEDNKGFGRANNQAFKQSQGRYLFLLNPDAMLLTEMDLSHAFQYMEAHPEVGLLGTGVMDSGGKVVTTASRHYPKQRQTTADFSHLPGQWATVLGASMVVRRDVFEKVGGFDEDFFLYAEETDLCLRIRQAGYQIGYHDGVMVKHVGGASERGHPKAEIIRKKKAGKYLFYRKHYPMADVIKLVRREQMHARFHLVRLLLKKWLMGLSEQDRAKCTHLRVSAEMAGGFLRDRRVV